MTADHAARRDRVRAALPDDTAGLLVTGLVNVRYLSGFSGSNAALLVGREPGDDVIATDSRYVLQVAAEAPGLEVVVERPCAAALLARVRGRGPARTAFEADHLTVAGYAGLLSDDDDLVPTTALVERLRTVKDATELSLLREACRITDAALAHVMNVVHEGMTERQVARELDDRMLTLGAEAPSFSTIVASGPNSAVPHHTPTDRALRRSDLLKIDFGARHAGYHADETRTFVVGAPPADWQQELHDLVREAQAAGRSALAVGASLRDVDAAARDRIESAGHGEHFGHGLGHGVGLEIHEAPMIGQGARGSLSDCTPVTVEPGVYLPGRGGVRIEDTLVVRHGAPETLTTTTRELLVLG